MEFGNAVRKPVTRTLRNFSVVLLGGVLVNLALAQAPADQIWNELASGNRRIVRGKSKPHNLVARRRELAKTQNPRAAVLSCSDSRVPPELVFDQGLGELFVVRSAGENADPIAIGSLEYAVEHLGSTVIVVMGHQSCGAVKAACSGGKPESANLDAVLSPISSSCAKADPKNLVTLDLAVRDHVHVVAQQLIANSDILKTARSEEHTSELQSPCNLVCRLL